MLNLTIADIMMHEFFKLKVLVLMSTLHKKAKGILLFFKLNQQFNQFALN